MDPLNRTLLDLHARADADPYFADIGLYVMRPRLEANGEVKESASFATIQQQVNNALACLLRKGGKGGAAVLFLMPAADADKPNVSGPQLKLTYTIRVQEDPIANFGPHGTRKTAEEIALHVLQLFHLVRLNGGNCLSADPDALTPIEPTRETAGLVTYNVRLTQLAPLAPPRQVAMPLIAVAEGLVTLTCATGGARIFYTVDGSYPSAVNPAATLYAAPFAAPTSALLRAAAEVAGSPQSDIAQSSFP